MTTEVFAASTDVPPGPGINNPNGHPGAPELPGTPVLSESELADIHAWWRAANYLAVGQIYLLGNALLRRDLVAEDVKPRLLGHWGTTPGLNFIYAHLNRIIRRYDANMVFNQDDARATIRRFLGRLSTILTAVPTG
jgi:hypothetical protein